jgi:dUTP pyrophosphatase
MKEQLQILNKQLFEIQVEVLDDGKLPTKAHMNDSGFDVYATSDVVIYPGQVIKHPLNIKVKTPADSYLSIESKSGLGVQGLLVYAGVIDAGYRGIVHAVISNIKHRNEDLTLNVEPLVIKKGQKIAQMIPYQFSTNYFVTQVEYIDNDSSRGVGGFGSSGEV